MKNIYVINYNDKVAENMKYYLEIGAVINQIREICYKKTGKEVYLYLEFFEDGLKVLDEDIIENNVEFVSNIIDCYSIMGEYYDGYSSDGYGIGREDKSKLKIKRTSKNSLYYYKDLGVFAALISIPSNHGRNTYFTVFCNSDKEAQAYLDYVSKRIRDTDKNFVTIFTDTDRGIKTTIERITREIQREEVILNEDLKNEIFSSIDGFFKNDGEFYKKFNLPYRRGILLYGKPGNGKTTLVKSIAGSVDAPVVYWQVTEFTSSQSISNVFESVARKSPAILVIEDLDSIPKAARSMFLNTLDGVSSKEGIFIIGTTNYPENVDEALMNRAGRFDHAYEIPKPDKNARRLYLEKKNILELISEDQLQVIINLTDDFSMSILNEIYTLIALQKFNGKKVDIMKILKSLNDSNKKQKTNDFYKNEQSIGFGVN